MPSTACPARGLARAGWFRLLGDTSTYITRYYHLSFKKCVEKKWSKYPVPRVIREHIVVQDILTISSPHTDIMAILG